MLSDWLDEKLGNHKWKLIALGCISVLLLVIFGGKIGLVLSLIILFSSLLVITVGIIVDPVAPSVFGRDSNTKAVHRSDFIRLLNSFTSDYMYDFDYNNHLDCISHSTVAKYKALPKAPAESITKLYNEHLMLIKSNMRTRIGRMSDLERSLIEELERSIDIQYKYHIEHNLEDDIKALHSMNNHYAELLDYGKREPK